MAIRSSVAWAIGVTIAVNGVRKAAVVARVGVSVRKEANQKAASEEDIEIKFKQMWTEGTTIVRGSASKWQHVPTHFVGCFGESQLVTKKSYGNENGTLYWIMREHALYDRVSYFAMMPDKVGNSSTVVSVGANVEPMYGKSSCGTMCKDEPSKWCGQPNRFAVYGIWEPPTDKPTHFAGCFGEDQLVTKTYYGGLYGTLYNSMHNNALDDSVAYFAMARHVWLGNAFTVKSVGANVEPTFGYGPCGTRCSDDSSKWCGCANDDHRNFPNPDCKSGAKLFALYGIGEVTYDLIPKACVKDHNHGPISKDSTVQECSTTCSSDPVCRGFGFKVNYLLDGGAGDCQLKSSANIIGCDGKWLDFYRKAR